MFKQNEIDQRERERGKEGENRGRKNTENIETTLRGKIAFSIAEDCRFQLPFHDFTTYKIIQIDFYR